MKKFRLLSMLGSVAIVVSLIVVGACTKEGPPGKDGVDGLNGEPGINGTDGTATCGVCHDNSEGVEIKVAQWEKSYHAMGGHNFENAPGCAPCHTSQGFKEVIMTDTSATLAAIADPANINCYTCHKIHDSYAVGDWELRKTTPMTFWLTGTTVDLGKGNLCVQCHQPRKSYQIPDVNNPEGIYTVGSTRFGPHHGGQGAILTGDAMYLVGGGYTNSSHAGIEDACVTCHMADPIGYTAGGHSFNMYDDYEGEYNVAGCTPCHTTDEAIEAIEALHPEIEALLAELGTLLEAAGIYNPAGTSGYAIKGDFPNKVAGAYWNWISIEEDRSLGVHNPKFVKRILEKSIESLQ